MFRVPQNPKPHRSLQRERNSFLPWFFFIVFIREVSHKYRARRKSAWKIDKVGAPEEVRDNAIQCGVGSMAITDSETREGGEGEVPRTPSGPSLCRAGRSRLQYWSVCALLLHNALRAERFDKAWTRGGKRQLCSRILGSCHPVAPWGCTCVICMFLSQRPREKKQPFNI